MILNGCWLTIRIYENYKFKEKRKKDLDVKCKQILTKNPEILHYFGSINGIHMTNLNESNFNFFHIDLLNSVEFLLEGTKRTGKVSIRYYLSNPALIKQFVQKQSENYENLLKISKNSKMEAVQEKVKYDFNYKNIWKSQITNGENKVIFFSNRIKIPITSDLNTSNTGIENNTYYGLFHNFFNFYYFNKASNTAAMEKFDNSKINQSENFYAKYRKYLEEKYNSDIENNKNVTELQNNHQNEEMFIPLFTSFMNNLETESNKDKKDNKDNKDKKDNKDNDQVDILIQDIFIKKNFCYYSITPQKYDSKEYISENTKLDNDSISSLYNSQGNENNNLNVFKIASELIKEKTIVSQYNEITKDKNSLFRNSLNNKNEDNNSNYNNNSTDDLEYDYNYPFIEELCDGIQMDWRINYLIFCSLFVSVYFLIYSISLQKINYSLLFDGKTIIKHVKTVKSHNFGNSPFFYYLFRSPFIFHYDRYIKISINDPVTIDKFRTTLVFNQMNKDIHILHEELKSNDINSKENIKI